ncbi:MAG TPA: hypothetical protein VJQ54_13775, partial [Candidatus Sulfotelmatobacter sp.]|nr:hypothetical protein [Candidatus Sulfotelmatobacter sp.]
MPESLPEQAGASYKNVAGELEVPIAVPTAAPPMPDVLARPFRISTGVAIWLRDLIISLAISAFI